MMTYMYSGFRILSRPAVIIAVFIGLLTAYKLCLSIDSDSVIRVQSGSKIRSIAEHQKDIFSDYSNGTMCRSKQDIVFLKVHKCSSSTVQNLMFRFGEKHGLNFVLPPKDNYLGDPQNTRFDRRYMMDFPTKKYNILCHHTRFSEKNIVELMPTDSVYITILRDPVAMYESLFTYSRVAHHAQITRKDPLKNLDQFLSLPDVYYEYLVNNPPSNLILGHLKNPMLYDMGLPIRFRDNQDYIEAMINMTDRRFDLVMMTEHIHESLILLQELLCWSLDDVVFFHLNSRTKSPKVSKIGRDLADKIRAWNSGDVKLYDHFNRIFWRKVDEFGVERMKKRVNILKEYNQYLYNRCIDDVINDPRVWHPENIKVDTLKVKETMKDDPMCVAMTRPELNYTDYLRVKQLEKYT